jgi:hypothetical protein
VLRVSLTLLCADLSYRLVEKPFRHGLIGRAYRTWRTSNGWRRALGPLKAGSVTVVLLAGVVIVAGQLMAAKAPADAPIGPGPDTALGALASPSAAPSGTPSPIASGSPSPSPSATGPPPGGVPTVAIFGDSQGHTLLLNVPKDTGKYVHFEDDTIEGCGFLLGKVQSRSGERLDLSANCPNWQSVWRARASQDKPDIGMIMVGAWDVFDLTLNGHTLAFGSADWDANYNSQLAKAIGALKAGAGHVAISLLPCYRPVRASAGYWPERGDDWRTRHINTLLTAAANNDPAYVSVVKPPHQFCEDPAIATSLSYRWDGVHYYKPGALLYCQAVIPQLLAIRRQ